MKNLSNTTRLVLAWLLVVSAGALSAQVQNDDQRINLTVGDIRDVAVDFPVKSFEPGNKEIIEVKLAGALGSQKVTVKGLKEGQSDLKVVGDGEFSKTFKITVGASIFAWLSEMRKDLDSLPGVEAEVSLSTIVLRGTITKPQDWSYLKKTILPSYPAGMVRSTVRFRLQDDLLFKLREDLMKSRFKVQEGTEVSRDVGVLNLHSSDNNVVISGSVYSHGELDSIRALVASNPWLKVRKEGEKDGDDACYAVINVAIAPVMLELDVIFVGVTEAEATTLGMNLLKNGLGTVQAAGNVVGNTINPIRSSGGFVVSGSTDETLKAILSGGPGRISEKGHLTFMNNATEWKRLKDGGTIQYPINGGSGGSGSLSPVQHGLIFEVKGGLSDSANLIADVRLQLSVPVPMGTSQAGPIFNVLEKVVDTTISCPVGKTLIVGGTKRLTEGVQIKSGTPILGQLPLLQFLFSEREKIREGRQLLVLVSPQLARSPTSSAPLVEQTLDTEQKADKPISILKPNLK